MEDAVFTFAVTDAVVPEWEIIVSNRFEPWLFKVPLALV